MLSQIIKMQAHMVHESNILQEDMPLYSDMLFLIWADQFMLLDLILNAAC